MTVQGKRAGTLELMTYNGRLNRSITNSHAIMDGNGELAELEAIPGAAPIVRADISGDALSVPALASRVDPIQALRYE